MSVVREKGLECPFTWDIDTSAALRFDEKEEVSDDKDIYVPFLTLMESITKIYVRAIKGLYSEAESALRISYNLWDNLDKKKLESDHICPSVVEHILHSTDYCLGTRSGRPSKSSLDNLLAAIADASTLSSAEQLGTLEGCRGIGWSLFYEPGMDAAIHFSRRARDLAPACPTWHFLLGKHLRRKRRADKCLQPWPEEAAAFARCYELSRNPHYGIYLAQMHRESRRLDQSRRIYLGIYEARPTCSNIQMRLALGFVRQRDFERAKCCLDYVEAVCPESPMFLHYKGIYYQKTEQYEKAVECFKRAGTFASHLQYAECMIHVDPDFDILSYLITLLKKFENNNTSKQTILLHMALVCYYKYKDVQASLRYLLIAIELNPSSAQFENAFDIVHNRPCNIVNLIYFKMLPEYKQSVKPSPRLLTNKDLKKLGDFCRRFKTNKTNINVNNIRHNNNNNNVRHYNDYRKNNILCNDDLLKPVSNLKL